MRQEIEAILKELHPDFDYSDSDDFIEDGYLDSYDMMTLISELENSFGIIIESNDIDPDNFKTVETIIEMVNRCKMK